MSKLHMAMSEDDSFNNFIVPLCFSRRIVQNFNGHKNSVHPLVHFLNVCSERLFQPSLEEVDKSFHCLSEQWIFRVWKCIYIYTWPKHGDSLWLKLLKLKGFVLHREKKKKKSQTPQTNLGELRL